MINSANIGSGLVNLLHVLEFKFKMELQIENILP